MVCRAYGGQAKISAAFRHPARDSSKQRSRMCAAKEMRTALPGRWRLLRTSFRFTMTWRLQLDSPRRRLTRRASTTCRNGSPSASDPWAGRCTGAAILLRAEPPATGCPAVERHRAKLHLTHCEAILADSFIREGRLAEARAHLDAARLHCAGYGEDYLAAEIDRLETCCCNDEKAPADIIDEYLMRSLNTARRQGARLLNSVRPRRSRECWPIGRARRAVDLLAPVFGWFTEGFDTADLKGAKLLLNELGLTIRSGQSN